MSRFCLRGSDGGTLVAQVLGKAEVSVSSTQAAEIELGAHPHMSSDEPLISRAALFAPLRRRHTVSRLMSAQLRLFVWGRGLWWRWITASDPDASVLSWTTPF